MLELLFIIGFLLFIGKAIDNQNNEVPHYNEGLSDEIYQDVTEGMLE